jgi:sulfatase maturation enzyme AslB (radical SAM superfamily)
MIADPVLVPCDDLPIYRLPHERLGLFYAPGYLAIIAPGRVDPFEQRLGSPSATGVAGELRAHAREALTTHRRRHERPYAPTCLTLYLHDGCSLHCTYCVSDPFPRPRQRLELEDVRAAAATVIENCLARGTPFTVVCHGGGEPTLEPSFLFRVLEELDAMAEARGVRIWRYLATNGVMPGSVARRVAHRFDLVGLSCDGPEDVQAVQRPLRRGGSSTPHVEATADAIRAAGTPLHVRTTVLPANADRLPEISEYLCSRLGPREIAAEPVYVGGRTTARDAPAPEDAEPMVDAFEAAEAVAISHGVAWTTSGSRPGDVHGAYCNVDRDVLQLVPGGAASACFKTQDAVSARRTGLAVGARVGARFELDERAVARVRQRAAERPACRACFNRFHCVRSCPDVCPALGAAAPDGFRCRFQRLLTLRKLTSLAAERGSGDGTIEEGITL